MDISKAIEYLYEEKRRLEHAILSLEELRREGNPTPAPDSTPGRRGRKMMDLAERQEVSRRMKRYWASRRAGPGTVEAPEPDPIVDAPDPIRAAS